MKNLTFIIILTLIFQSEIIPQSCLPDGITFSTQAEIDNFQINYPNCSSIEGSVTISGPDVTNLDGLSVINSFLGNLNIWDNDILSSISGLINVTSVEGTISIGHHTFGANPSLESLDGLDNLYHVGGDLRLNYLYSLTDISALNDIDTVWGTLTFLNCESLSDLSGIESLRYIGGSLEIYDDDSLYSLHGLEALNFIGGDLFLKENKSLQDINSLWNITTIGKELVIYNNDSISNLSGLNNITYVGEHLGITGNPLLTSLAELSSLEIVEEYISIRGENIENLHGLSSLTAINDGGIYIQNTALSNLSGLENLTEVNGAIMINNCNNLISLSGIENISPDSITLLRIRNNSLLTTCEVESVCGIINQSWSEIDIIGNAVGCSTEDEIEEACELLNIDNFQHKNGPLIYPNPASNSIEFSRSNADNITYVKIYNQFGQEIICEQNILNSIDVSKLIRGIYIVEIMTIDSKTIQKLIIQ